jgi:hypothetical protein
MLKLVQIAAASEFQDLRIRARSVERAMDWLLSAEHDMPDVFREMDRKSDKDVINELWHYVFTNYTKEKRPIAGSRMWNFLQARVPSQAIPRILEVVEKANIIQRLAGTTDLWIPRPRHEHGME